MQLQHLGISFGGNESFKDFKAARLQKLPNLQSLAIHNCENLTDGDVGLYLATCPELRDVRFEECKGFTHTAAELLVRCPKLRVVDFDNCSCTCNCEPPCWTEEVAKCLAKFPQLEPSELNDFLRNAVYSQRAQLSEGHGVSEEHRETPEGEQLDA